MKKICFVATIPGTVRTFTLPVIRQLLEKTDWEISVICNYDEKFAALLPPQVRYIPVAMKRGVSLGGIGAVAKMARIFRKEKFDLIQYSTPNAAFYASIAAKMAGAERRKYHLMGFRFLGFTGWRRWLFKAFEKIACGLSTDIECVSHSNLELGVAEGVFQREKARVLFYGSSAGVDLSRFDVEQKPQWRQELRQAYGFGSEECVFGFAGRITGDKGINELFTAMESLEAPNARLFLAGVLEEVRSLDPELLERAKNSDKVTFCGYVPDIHRYFAMMDVLVLPSYREGFGNIIIEAQAMGLPVIVTDIPGPIDAMEADVTGLTVPVGDVAALEQAMTTLCTSREIREEMGQQGLAFVRERFDQEKLAQVILEDRRALLSEK